MRCRYLNVLLYHILPVFMLKNMQALLYFPLGSFAIELRSSVLTLDHSLQAMACIMSTQRATETECHCAPLPCFLHVWRDPTYPWQRKHLTIRDDRIVQPASNYHQCPCNTVNMDSPLCDSLNALTCELQHSGRRVRSMA